MVGVRPRPAAESITALSKGVRAISDDHVPRNAPGTTTHQAPHGTYGLRLTGVDGAGRLLDRCRPDWPSLHVCRAAPADAATECDGDSATVVRLDSGAVVSVDAASARARVRLGAIAGTPTDEELVHPFLFGAAAVANMWLGRQTFHAGAFGVDGAAWAMAGHKGAGKTSTLALVARHAAAVLTDDLLVIDDGDVLAGPACLDLRGDAATRLEIGRDLGVVGTRRRWRQVVAPAPTRTPLAGWIYPAWGDRIDVGPIGPTERLRLLFAAQALRIAPLAPAAMIELATLPAVRFVRPRDWREADTAARRLLDAIAAMQ